MCAVRFPSLVASANICSNSCGDSGFDIAAENNASAGAGVVPRIPPPYSVDEYNPKYSVRISLRLDRIT